MMLIIGKFKVLVAVVEHRRRAAPQYEPRRRIRRTCKLGIGLFEMVRVQVTVAARPDELSRLQIALLREHVREERVRGDIEGHAEKKVCASLVELARQAPAGDVQLEERVA